MNPCVHVYLGGSAGANKTGAGTVSFTGSNSYTGVTTVSAGQLTLGHATNTLADASTLVVSGTGTLDMGANSDTVAGVQLESMTMAKTGSMI